MYDRVSVCNCGCPFKGPSQTCPWPFDQTFYDWRLQRGPGDGRIGLEREVKLGETRLSLWIWPRYSIMTSAAFFTLSKSCENLQEGQAKVFVNVCFILNLHYYSARTSDVCGLLCCSRNRGQRFLGIRFTLILHFFCLVDREWFL